MLRRRPSSPRPTVPVFAAVVLAATVAGCVLDDPIGREQRDPPRGVQVPADDRVQRDELTGEWQVETTVPIGGGKSEVEQMFESRRR